MSTESRSLRRRLTRGERELWASVTRAITPLRPAEPAADPAPAGPGQQPAVPETPSAPEQRARETPVPAFAGFDRRLRQRLARGRASIDDSLDLHGLTQAQAHDALARFLPRARTQSARFVLVITGKGSRGEEDRGVLRRLLPLWLKSPKLREHVVGFESAGRAHGREGAFYVRLRRLREHGA